MLKAALLLVIYLVTHHVLDSRIDALGAYAMMTLELGLIGAALLAYRGQTRVLARPEQGFRLEVPVAAVLGLVAFRGAVRLGVVIPFDFHDPVFVVMLVVLGPVLEELLFRQALWLPVAKLTHGSRAWTIALTTVLFAAGHFQAWFRELPEGVRAFVLFQTAYTAVVGAWWGWAYARTRALRVPVALHIAFNLGFYLGSLLQ